MRQTAPVAKATGPTSYVHIILSKCRSPVNLSFSSRLPARWRNCDFSPTCGPGFLMSIIGIGHHGNAHNERRHRGTTLRLGSRVARAGILCGSRRCSPVGRRSLPAAASSHRPPELPGGQVDGRGRAAGQRGPPVRPGRHQVRLGPLRQAARTPQQGLARLRAAAADSAADQPRRSTTTRSGPSALAVGRWTGVMMAATGSRPNRARQGGVR